MRTRWALQLLAAAALLTAIHIQHAAQAQFTSQRADASLCSAEGCIDFKLVLANFGVFPYGEYLECASSLNDFRIWQPGVAADYPASCGTGVSSFCQYSCVREALETDNGLLELAPNSAIGVIRSFGSAQSPAECSFFTKVQVAQTTKAEAIIVMNERDSSAITMDTTKDNGELSLDAQTKPAFLMEQQYVSRVKELLNSTAETEAVRLTIDLRNVFPENGRVDVTMWGSRLWSCASHVGTEQDCRRRVEMLGPSDFSDAMGAFLRQEVARIFIRQPNVDVCRKQDNTTTPTEFEAFCNNTQQVEAHCIHGGRYCQPQDPDGSPVGSSGGREALIEMLRCKCVQQVSQNFQEAQFYFSYMQVWANVCQPKGDYSNECSLGVFRNAAISQWSQESLAKANATREVPRSTSFRSHSDKQCGMMQEVQQALSECVEINTADLDEDVANSFFDEDARLDATVFIDPTLTVNGKQVRGAYTAENMVPAICSAFPDGSEPPMCLTANTDVCSEGSAAYQQCRSGYFAAAGRTRCKPTFGSYECACGFNQEQMDYQPTPEEQALFPNLTGTEFYRCLDQNQCMPELEACDSEEICLSTASTHECLSTTEACTAAKDWGLCYVSDLRPLGDDQAPPLTACVSRISELRARAAAGDEAVRTAAAFNCSCAALPCHQGSGTSCEQLCPLEECLNRDNPAISTCIVASESRGVGIGPISSGGVVGIVAGACMLIMIAGLLLAMRYQKQNRDRLVDLDALVRGFTLGSDGTPNNPPYTPGGRLMGTNTPSSMYNNAAFQHRTRDLDSSPFLAGPDSRGPSSAGTGPAGPYVGGGTGGTYVGGFSGGTTGASGERLPHRPTFASMIAQGHRDSPPARRTIRPPAPGHVPLAQEDDFGSMQMRGPQREIVIGPRPLAEDRSASVSSHGGSMRILDAFGSISEVMRSWGSRQLRKSPRSHSGESVPASSASVKSVSTAAGLGSRGKASPAAVVVAGQSAAGATGNGSSNGHNSAERETKNSETEYDTGEMDSESFRIIDEVLKRGEVEGDVYSGGAELDTSRFADATLRTMATKTMGSMEDGLCNGSMSSFAGVTASSGGLSPGGCHFVPRENSQGLQGGSTGGIEEIVTPDITEGHEEEEEGQEEALGRVKKGGDRESEMGGETETESEMRNRSQAYEAGGSSVMRALQKAPGNSSALQMYSSVPGAGDSSQHQMWATIGSAALGAVLEGGSESTGLQLKSDSTVLEDTERAGAVVEESSRLSGGGSGGGNDDELAMSPGRGGTASMMRVDIPSPVGPGERFDVPYEDATDDLPSTTELFAMRAVRAPRRSAQRTVPAVHSSGAARTKSSCNAVQALSGMDSVPTPCSSAGATVSSGSRTQATIASRVDPVAAADSTVLGSSSFLGSIHSSSFDVIKRIHMMLPGWRHSQNDDSLANPVAEGPQEEERDDGRSGSTAVRAQATSSLGEYPSLQLSQLRECQDLHFDSVNTCEQFV